MLHVHLSGKSNPYIERKNDFSSDLVARLLDKVTWCQTLEENQFLLSHLSKIFGRNDQLLTNLNETWILSSSPKNDKIHNTKSNIGSKHCPIPSAALGSKYQVKNGWKSST